MSEEIKLSHRSRKRIRDVKKKARPGKIKFQLNFFIDITSKKNICRIKYFIVELFALL